MTLKKKVMMLVAAAVPAIAPVAIAGSCGNSNKDEGTKVIHTLSLSPVVLDKANVGTYFDVTDPKKPTQKPMSIDFKGTKIDSSKKLATIVSDPENPRWQVADKELAAAASENGFNNEHNILKTQNEQNSWLGSRTDKNAWILGATDDSIAAAMSGFQGPIIAYDRLIKANQDNYNWYVSYDNAGVGRLQGISIVNALFGTDIPNDGSITADKVKEAVTTALAKTTAKAIADDSYIISVAGDPADNNASLFFGGAVEVIKAAMADTKGSKLHWATGADDFNSVAQATWNYESGKQKLASEIGGLNGKKILAALCPNDGMATSAINALNDAKLDPKTIYITGLDANPVGITQILDGDQNMTLFKPDASAARLAVALASILVTNPNATEAEINTFLKAAYPSVKFSIDNDSYKV